MPQNGCNYIQFTGGHRMNYEEFKENLAKDVKEQMEARSGSEVTVETRTVEKMNETYDALTVKPEDSIIGVNLNTKHSFLFICLPFCQNMLKFFKSKHLLRILLLALSEFII